MEHLPGYDDWKARHDWNGGGSGNVNHSRTRMEWYRAYRAVKRQQPDGLAAWLDEQRSLPAFAGFVREVEMSDARHGQR